jgi:hypothetical protein
LSCLIYRVNFHKLRKTTETIKGVVERLEERWLGAIFVEDLDTFMPKNAKKTLDDWCSLPSPHGRSSIKTYVRSEKIPSYAELSELRGKAFQAKPP